MDVTVQAAYLALLNSIQEETELAILFITHDFGVVTRMCDRVAVMYGGRIVETASARELFENPLHPYTEALLKSVPDLHRPTDWLPSIQGSPPSIYNMPAGCAFSPRCPYVMPRCREAYPGQVDVDDSLRVENLKKHFPVAGPLPWSRPEDFVYAVDGVSFELRRRETLSIVGESGCGKTTTARLVLRLEHPTEGRVVFKGKDTCTLRARDLAAYRKNVQAVFQNPFSSLNPRMRGLELVGEPLIANSKVSRNELKEEVKGLLAAVGLDPSTINAFPHELSGGMRQRLAVARALILRPSLIVLDEPVSALDVSVRAQIMNLLKKVQEEFDVGYLLIAHDLATTRYLSHRILVMYLGQVVETATSAALFTQPMHPYTKALISAATLSRRWEKNDEIILAGEVPSPLKPPSGCRFHTRCPFAFDRCKAEVPQLRQLSPGQQVACHLY